MASDGPPGLINGHCLEKPRQPNSPIHSVSNTLGRTWLRPLLKQKRMPDADLSASQYFTALFQTCPTPVYLCHSMPRTGAMSAISAISF